MIVSDKSLISKSKQGAYPNVKSLFSTIPRDMRMHMYRVGSYGQVLLDAAREQGVWDFSLPGDIVVYSEEIFRLHDIGRHYISAEIYNKVEALTDAEKIEIKKHTLYALMAEKSVFFPIFPKHIMPYFRQVAVLHHERLDGRGYPYGRKGTEIPYMARVCAIADAYDGMVSWKPYRESMSSEQALAFLQRDAGTQFQPELVECFIKCRKELETIAREMDQG